MDTPTPDPPVICGLCGTEIPREPGKPGRRRRFCCDDCYQAHKVVARAGKLLKKVIPRMKGAPDGPRHASLLRGRLWGLCNQLNAVGKPVRASGDDAQAAAGG